MSLDFQKFKTATATQFKRMAQHELFTVDVDLDVLWNTYLDSFPPGTNTLYRERREYDCSCCRGFVKRVGHVVALIDGEVKTIWDLPTGVPEFDIVSKALADLVRSRPIQNVFRTAERTAGQDKSFEELSDPLNPVKTWEHFFVNIPNAFILKKDRIGPELSELQASHDVLLRSLTELTLDAAQTVSELIAQGSLYRGAENKRTIDDFIRLKKLFATLPKEAQDRFVWATLSGTGGAVARIRNTSIGTLLIDLSEGLDLESAVRKYEAVVAPSNYKRPTALVTQKMVDQAKATVEELGLTSALQRRYANLDDLDVTNLLFVDRSTTPIATLSDDAFAGVANKSSKPKLDKVEAIPLAKFLKDVLPTARSIEVMLDGSQTGNLASLITASDPTAQRLFKWDNPFSWSYNGDVADSIKERVKAAGGNVTGDVCCRLAWFNYDDLDFHMVEPNGYEVNFRTRTSFQTGGKLDVDMNAGSGTTRTPVENIFYSKRSTMKPGKYFLKVHQFTHRDPKDGGFEVEVDILGQVTRFAYEQPVIQGRYVDVATIEVSKTGEITLTPKLPSTSKSREVWGLKTNNFHRVRALLRSPNFWQEPGVGNEHIFFMLDGCVNEGNARGFYNEFLRPELDKHRKVVELVGSKMRTAETPNQLSGLGFSTTKRASVLVRVTSNFTRTLRVEI